MHEETYPAFFTPRDEEPSLSSSEEKSSEFDLLEIEITRQTKIYMKNRAIAIFLTYTKGCLPEQAPESYLNENYNNNYYMDIYPFS